MADTLNNNNSKVTNPTPQQNMNPQAPVPQPPVPPVNPPTQPPQAQDTGAQYEKNELAPEDLDARWLRWKCGVCNYTYEGSKPLRKCPRCGNEDQDKFLDAD
jgi:hypothetical protein